VFFFFNVALVVADIVTDSISAYFYFIDGDENWGRITIIPIFLPFLIRLVMAIAGLYKTKNQAERGVKLQNFKHLLWHLPFLHPVK